MVSTHRGKIIILIISNKKSAFCWGKKFYLPDCKNKVFFFLHEGPLEVLGKSFNSNAPQSDLAVTTYMF